jgi:hypothetical protein
MLVPANEKICGQVLFRPLARLRAGLRNRLDRQGPATFIPGVLIRAAIDSHVPDIEPET